MRLGRLHHVVQRLQLIAVGCALRNAQVQRRHGQHFALRIQHVDLAREFLGRIEQDVGGVDFAVIDIAADRERGRAPLVGDRMHPPRIEGRIGPFLGNIALVRQLALGDLVQHAFAQHDLDHVVAGHGHVIGAHRAGLQRGQQGFVAVIGVHDHLDIILLGKLVQQLLRDVFEPVIDHQPALGRHRARGQRQRGGRRGCLENGFHE